MAKQKDVLKEGTEVFYIVGPYVFSGKAVDIEMTDTGFKFAIDTYGACEGNFRIDSGMIGINVFLNQEDAQKLADDPDYAGGFSASC